MFHVKQNEEILRKSRPELEKFSNFVLKWQKSLNLISPSTIPDIWHRHIVDSAQLYTYLPNNTFKLVDMGSGAGFPGMVLAIINQLISGPVRQFYFIESDIKKAIFLREAVRVFHVPVTILNDRIENVKMDQVDVVTARALKTVPELLKMGEGFINFTTTCLFLKGSKVDEELALVNQPINVQKFPSQTHKEGVILQINEVKI